MKEPYIRAKPPPAVSMPLRGASRPSSIDGSAVRSPMRWRGELIDRDGAGIEIVGHGALDVAAGEPDRNFGPVSVAPDGVLVPEILEQHEVVLEALRAA